MKIDEVEHIIECADKSIGEQLKAIKVSSYNMLLLFLILFVIDESRLKDVRDF